MMNKRKDKKKIALSQVQFILYQLEQYDIYHANRLRVEAKEEPIVNDAHFKKFERQWHKKNSNKQDKI